jgi:hypothetical protein
MTTESAAGPPAKAALPRRVWLLTVTDQDVPIEQCVFSSKARARRWLAAWCHATWDDQGGHDEDLPATTSAAIAHYFEFWDEQGYDLDEATLDPEDPEL